MDSPNVSTHGKSSKRILPGTPIAVTVPKPGDVSLFYKAREDTTDGIYESLYLKGEWKGGLSAPPIFKFPATPNDPYRMAAISWNNGKEVSVLASKLILQSCY
jgi:hypothetical protein